MGARVVSGDDSIRVFIPEDTVLQATSFRTIPYPGFPTDLQPQNRCCCCCPRQQQNKPRMSGIIGFSILMTQKTMGADIMIAGRLALIEGGNPLTGAKVFARDPGPGGDGSGQCRLPKGRRKLMMSAKSSVATNLLSKNFRTWVRISPALTALMKNFGVKACALRGGSSGNSIFIGCNQTRLVDAGISSANQSNNHCVLSAKPPLT